MKRTASSSDKIASDQTSPYLDELRDRRAAIAEGAEPWSDPVEQRREARRHHLEIMRTVSVESGVRLNEAMAGRLQPVECPLFKDMKDPIASLAKLNISIVQITLAEERLDETVPERTARLAAEREADAEALARAERKEAADRDYNQSQIRRSENRQQVRLTVSEITLARLRPLERNRLLSRLLADLDKDRAAYDRDPAQLIAEITSRLGLAPDLPAADKAYFAKRRESLIAGARDHLEVFGHPHDDDEDDDSVSSQAQGPPH